MQPWVIGHDHTGLRSFLMRGLDRVKAEFNLASIPSKLKKIKESLEESDTGAPMMKLSKRNDSLIGMAEK